MTYRRFSPEGPEVSELLYVLHCAHRNMDRLEYPRPSTDRPQPIGTIRPQADRVKLDRDESPRAG